MLAFSFREFLLNVAANIAAAQVAEMIGWLVGIGCVLLWLVQWDSKRRAKEKRGMDSWYLISLSLLVSVVAMGAAAYGIGLRSAPLKAAAEQPKEVVATHIDFGKPSESKSVLVANRYYSTKNKEEVAGFLDKISDTINKVGEETLLLAENAINKSPWDRPGENIDPFLKRMDEISALTVKIRAYLYDDLLAKEREYRVEMNGILFPQDPLINFQTTAKEFRNGLSVWMKVRDNVESDSDTKQGVLQLTHATRMSFGVARDVFVKWLSERQEIIGQTRRALRS